MRTYEDDEINVVKDDEFLSIYNTHGRGIVLTSRQAAIVRMVMDDSKLLPEESDNEG